MAQEIISNITVCNEHFQNIYSGAKEYKYTGSNQFGSQYSTIAAKSKMDMEYMLFSANSTFINENMIDDCEHILDIGLSLDNMDSSLSKQAIKELKKINYKK